MSTDIAQGIGHSARAAVYTIPDAELAMGSTLGAPKVCTILKGSGAIEQVYSPDRGLAVFGALTLRHWDEQTGMHLAPQMGGSFILHPEHQERTYTLTPGVDARESVFALRGCSDERSDEEPPAVYYTVEMSNHASIEARIATYAFCELRGETGQDVAARFDKKLNAFLVWNESDPDLVRVFGCSEKPTSFETTKDYARTVAPTCPGTLANATEAAGEETLGAIHLSHTLAPGETSRFSYLLSFSAHGRRGARESYRACPHSDAALAATRAYYQDMLNRSVVITPDPQVNRGVLWAKANMLRVQCKAPTGWCFVNDPTRSNNSVARDTAWFGFGADYLTPDFARASLLAYVRQQEPSGKIIEYYDIRNGHTEDYGLNINDDTPLLILALWHHYTATGDEQFLRDIYSAAIKAARYILSQRNQQGLIWCTAKGEADRGIAGWRNIIKHYRLSGATTEMNAECYAAVRTISKMARVLGRHAESAEFAAHAEALKTAINTHLLNPENGLYYLTIGIDGVPRSDVTADLVFPVMFAVADEETSARIIQRLSDPDFWTTAGMRTTPRSAPNYSPGREPAYGLMGGVWVGVTFWYAFAAARFNTQFMAHALSSSFQHYSHNPWQNGTVPGQFSEWLHGETLVNQGMMLSPWFPPRYLWAAIEGAAGLDLSEDTVQLNPHLASDWKWMAVHNLPYRGEWLTWLAVRAPEMQIHTNYHFHESRSYVAYDEDITGKVYAASDSAAVLGFRQGANLLLFVGNSGDLGLTTALHTQVEVSGSYRMRAYDSLLGHWNDYGLIPAEKLRQGIARQIERQGFWLLDLKQEN